MIYYLNREVCNLNVTDIKLQLNFVNDWHNELQSVSMFRTDTSFKSDYNFEKKNVTMNILKSHKSVLD